MRLRQGSEVRNSGSESIRERRRGRLSEEEEEEESERHFYSQGFHAHCKSIPLLDSSCINTRLVRQLLPVRSNDRRLESLPPSSQATLAPTQTTLVSTQAGPSYTQINKTRQVLSSPPQRVPAPRTHVAGASSPVATGRTQVPAQARQLASRVPAAVNETSRPQVPEAREPRGLASAVQRTATPTQARVLPPRLPAVPHGASSRPVDEDPNDTTVQIGPSRTPSTLIRHRSARKSTGSRVLLSAQRTYEFHSRVFIPFA